MLNFSQVKINNAHKLLTTVMTPAVFNELLNRMLISIGIPETALSKLNNNGYATDKMSHRAIYRCCNRCDRRRYITDIAYKLQDAFSVLYQNWSLYYSKSETVHTLRNDLADMFELPKHVTSKYFRNMGVLYQYGEENSQLAILDTTICKYMGYNIKEITNYEEYEKLFCDKAIELGIHPLVLDTLIRKEIKGCKWTELTYIGGC